MSDDLVFYHFRQMILIYDSKNQNRNIGHKLNPMYSAEYDKPYFTINLGYKVNKSKNKNTKYYFLWQKNITNIISPIFSSKAEMNNWRINNNIKWGVNDIFFKYCSFA
jgi:hypothetical protein